MLFRCLYLFMFMLMLSMVPLVLLPVISANLRRFPLRVVKVSVAWGD